MAKTHPAPAGFPETVPPADLRIDLRSDTVTRPTAAMREAMFRAEVGDDVYGEDPTVNRLEARAAEIFGREAALFVPTGSMGNQIAVHLHVQSGQELICDSRSHVFNWEMAMPAAFSGCLIRPVATARGVLTFADVLPALALEAPYHKARTGLVVIENTHNMAGGTAYTRAEVEAICAAVHARGVAVHLDGARVFNAAVALDAGVRELTASCDSVMFCLSKGLGAPVGSLLLGTRDFIHRARIVRKMLGGGMRQSGILAAAGLLALEEGPAQLPTDHANARLLAHGLSGLPGIRIDPTTVQTNIVIFDVSGTGRPAAELVTALEKRQVRAGAVGASAIRFVTHRDVTREQCEQAVAALAQELAS